VELTGILNNLQHVLEGGRNTEERNANATYMKLMNFRRYDPKFIAQGKSGLSKGNHLEYQRPAELTRRGFPD
jgi:hypothetical protein